ELLFFFDVVRIRQAALNRADRLAGLVIVEPDALGAEFGVDDVDFFALADRLVRALGLARAAVDAVGSDVGRHGVSKLRRGTRRERRDADARCQTGSVAPATTSGSDGEERGPAVRAGVTGTSSASAPRRAETRAVAANASAATAPA